MNQWIFRLVFLCALTGLLLTGCQSKAETFVPVTGEKEVSLAAPAELARDSALEYILSSARLTTLPPSTDWQPEVGDHPENEYHFRNGDWLMMIRLSDARQADQKIILFNQVEQISWSGYIRADGQVVDTSYGR